MTPAQWLLVVIAVFSGAIGAVLLKSGAPLLIFGQGPLVLAGSAINNWALILGLCLYTVPSAIAIYLLRAVDVSFLQPLLALTYVVTAALAVMIHGERVTLSRALGIVLIVVGVALVARSER